jgi:hypothetical protein
VIVRVGHVAKILVGINPAGAITFTFLPFPGKISDVDIIDKWFLLLELLDEGDDALPIHHLMALLGCDVLMAPKSWRGNS